jgi:RimJ/RimL family protein N-acetyltransferase
MDDNLFRGELVRLAADDSKTIAESYSRWSRDSEYLRLLDMAPNIPRSMKSTQDWLDKEMENDSLEFYYFTIHTLEDDRLIGDTNLDSVRWKNGDTFIGIALGERDYWGKGYGTDAMRLMLRFAFTELNLHRVSLDVFEYNTRAIRSYEKVGFKHEGRLRQAVHRDGQRCDLLYMGILRTEWMEKYRPEELGRR